MTRVTTTPLAVSADYADALLAARRAKNWLFLLLLLFLLAQITIFFLVRFNMLPLSPGEPSIARATVDDDGDDVNVEVTATQPATSPAAGDDPTTLPVTVEAGDTTATTAAETPRAPMGEKDVTPTVLAWVTNSIVYLGTIFSIVMTIIILLIVLIMLVGRLIGVSHSTSAFIWAVLLALLVFPWQLFYGAETAGGPPPYSASQATPSAVENSRSDFRVPGVLYTWGELRRDAHFSGDVSKNAVLKWARFAGFPFLALLILFVVQAKSGRAVKFALGEAEVHVDVATTDT